MKKTQHYSDSYTLSAIARTEQGRVEVLTGLDALSPQERKFIFRVLGRITKGGSVAMSLEPGDPGEYKLTLHLKEPNAVERSVKAEINGKPH